MGGETRQQVFLVVATLTQERDERSEHVGGGLSECALGLQGFAYKALNKSGICKVFFYLAHYMQSRGRGGGSSTGQIIHPPATTDVAHLNSWAIVDNEARIA